MPKVSDTRLIGLPRKQVYQFMMDVERYPDFIPFVQKVRIVEKDGPVTLADLAIGLGPFKFTYRSRIEETPFEEINIRDVPGEGPFAHLRSKLTFEDRGKDGTLVGYHFSSQFRSRSMNALADPIFDIALKNTLAEVERAIMKKKKR